MKQHTVSKFGDLSVIDTQTMYSMYHHLQEHEHWAEFYGIIE